MKIRFKLVKFEKAVAFQILEMNERFSGVLIEEGKYQSCFNMADFEDYNEPVTIKNI